MRSFLTVIMLLIVVSFSFAQESPECKVVQKKTQYSGEIKDWNPFSLECSDCDTVKKDSSATDVPSNFGFVAFEQREPWAGFLGLYWPSSEISGWTAQAQFINQPQVWLVGGYYVVVGDWFLEFNSGPVVFKEETRVSNWCLQINAALGDSKSNWNIFAGNEYDPAIQDKYDEIVFLLHHYLYKVASGLYFGPSIEYLKFGDDQYLMVSPMLKYYIKDNFKLMIGPRAKTAGTELKVGSFQWDNLYINLSYDFEF